MAAKVNNLAGEINAERARDAQIGQMLVARGRRVAAARPTCVGPCSLPERRGPTCTVTQQARGHPTSKGQLMRPIPEAADVTEADRLQCRTLIEAANFYALRKRWRVLGARAAERRVPGAGGVEVRALWQVGKSGPSSGTGETALAATRPAP